MGEESPLCKVDDAPKLVRLVVGGEVTHGEGPAGCSGSLGIWE